MLHGGVHLRTLAVGLPGPSRKRPVAMGLSVNVTAPPSFAQFSKWDQIFQDPMTTAAAIDRVVHHSVILELNVNSYRAEAAHQRSWSGRGKKDAKPDES